MISPIFFIRWKAMHDSALPPLIVSRWKESYCQLSTLLRAWASCENGGKQESENGSEGVVTVCPA